MTTKDSNRDNNNNVTVSKRNLILSLAVVVSLSVFLVVSGPLSSSLLVPSPIKIKQVVAQQQPSSKSQQPTSQPSSQPSTRPQQPSSSSSSSSSTTTLSPSTSGGTAVSPQAKGGGGGKTNNQKQCSAAGGEWCKGQGKGDCIFSTNDATCGATCSNPRGEDCNGLSSRPIGSIGSCVGGSCHYRCLDPNAIVCSIHEIFQCIGNQIDANCGSCGNNCDNPPNPIGSACQPPKASGGGIYSCQCRSGEGEINCNGQCVAAVCPPGSTGPDAQGQCTTTTAYIGTCDRGNPSGGRCLLPGPTCDGGTPTPNGLCDFGPVSCPQGGAVPPNDGSTCIKTTTTQATCPP